MNGLKSQTTAVTGTVIAAIFTIVNAFYPEKIPADVQAAVVTLVGFLYALFLAMKVERNKSKK